MFNMQVKELYKYLTKNELNESISIVKSERKSVVLYTLADYRWILAPNISSINKENFTTKYKVKDSTYLFFINDLKLDEIIDSPLCRELTIKDELIFNEFKKSCSKEDKEEGMVSLEDDFVYGLFNNKKIVAVSSLWNWGDIISDIGVLVHPNFRKKGYAKIVCQTLMKNIKRKFVWRCDSSNIASNNLAKSIGFIKSGLIQELEEI